MRRRALVPTRAELALVGDVRDGRGNDHVERHQPVDLVLDHALELAGSDPFDAAEATAELVALAQGDVLSVRDALELLKQVLGTEGVDDGLTRRAIDLLDAAIRESER